MIIERALLLLAHAVRRLSGALALVSVLACMGTPKTVKSKVNDPMRAKEKDRARVQRKGRTMKMTSKTPTHAPPYRVRVGDDRFLAFNSLGIVYLYSPGTLGGSHEFQALGDAVIWARALAAMFGTMSPNVRIFDGSARTVDPWPDDAPLGKDRFKATVDLERLRASFRAAATRAADDIFGRSFDHKYEAGAYAVCRRCGAEHSEHLLADIGEVLRARNDPQLAARFREVMNMPCVHGGKFPCAQCAANFKHNRGGDPREYVKRGLAAGELGIQPDMLAPPGNENRALVTPAPEVDLADARATVRSALFRIFTDVLAREEASMSSMRDVRQAVEPLIEETMREIEGGSMSWAFHDLSRPKR